MTDWDKLIEDVVYEAKNWFYDDDPLNKVVNTLRSAIAELEQERDERNETVIRLSKELVEVTKRANELYSQLAEVEAKNKLMHDTLINIFNLGIQHLDSDKRWGMTHAFVLDTIKKLASKRMV
jgi:uncharacterized coiled-coil DUF342 family protein